MFEITMPRLSEEMTEGKFLRWCVEEGSWVKAGEVIAEVETDKANMEIEALESGCLRQLQVQPGQTVPVGGVLGRLDATQGEPAPGAADAARNSGDLFGDSAKEKPRGAQRVNRQEPNVSPLAASLARQRGIDLAQVKGTGPAGRIMKVDVLAWQPEESVATLIPPPEASKPREVLSESQPKPHGMRFCMSLSVDCRPLKDTFPALTERVCAAQAGLADSEALFLAVVARAAALADRRAPLFGQPGGARGAREELALCAAMWAGEALEVRPLERCGLRPLAEVYELCARKQPPVTNAAAGTAQALTLINLQLYGVEEFYGLVEPEGAVLAIGQARGGTDRAKTLKMTLSVGAPQVEPFSAAHFLQELRQHLEHPMLIGGL